MIADRTAYNVRYSYGSLHGIAIVSMSIYLFTVKSAFDAGRLPLKPVGFDRAAHDPAPHVSARLSSALLSTAPNVSAPAATLSNASDEKFINPASS